MEESTEPLRGALGDLRRLLIGPDHPPSPPIGARALVDLVRMLARHRPAATVTLIGHLWHRRPHGWRRT